ncbi:MAG: hypothetical protein QNJ16_10405 [Rhodobacter sp.]|nr:hypothetical protein [Rhodobacter sp.]
MQVARLCHDEVVRLNADSLEAIYEEIGQDRGEVAISRAMEDLAALLVEAEAAWATGESAILRRHVAEVAGIAKRIGMPGLARVALDVDRICACPDDAALAAVVARMGRLGERSLIAVWDVQDAMI